jgi:Fe2+ or Zn2+ uptake regulation protein
MTLNYDELDLARTLRAAGLRATPQRVAILRSIEHDKSHPTAQALFERLRAEFPAMSFATVYNTLAALTKAGRVQPMHLGTVTRFDPNVVPHHHAICDVCGTVRDVPAADEPLLPASLAEGFEVRRVEGIFRGRCGRCRKTRRTSAR